MSRNGPSVLQNGQRRQQSGASPESDSVIRFDVRDDLSGHAPNQLVTFRSPPRARLGHSVMTLTKRSRKEDWMGYSIRQTIAAAVVSFCIGALVAPVATHGAQTNPAPAAMDQPKFIVVEFMKVAPGKMNDWVTLERETWKPIHQRRVKVGAIVSWASIAQVMPGDESDGPLAAAITTFRGWPDPTKDNYEALIKKVHPQTQPGTIFNQAEGARKIVRQEIWQVIDDTTP